MVLWESLYSHSGLPIFRRREHTNNCQKIVSGSHVGAHGRFSDTFAWGGCGGVAEEMCQGCGSQEWPLTVTGAEPSPALLVPSTKRRSRKSSKDTGEGKEGSGMGSEEQAAKGKVRGRKPSVKQKAGTRCQPLFKVLPAYVCGLVRPNSASFLAGGNGGES